MGTRLIDTLGTTDALSAVFSDATLLQLLLDVEAALARVQGRLGLIPASAAEAIGAAATAEHFDAVAIAREARRSGTPVISVVQALTARVRAADADAARFVHFGATSQDISDTAFVLSLARAHEVVHVDGARLAAALRARSNEHATTLMLGRTLLQPAPPITFGLKVAGWYSAAERGRSRLFEASTRASVLQFGGAAGTLASLGSRGPEVAKALAAELSLGCPPGPWHAHRDRLADLVCACGVYTASLGKIARDVSLLMQFEVGEAAEPGGGSSTMPHKRNPSGCAIALAAASRLPGLVSSFLSGMVQEHERGLGGLQAEWPVVVDAMQATGAAAAAMAGAIEALSVDGPRMRGNIEATRGFVFAERALMRLGPSLGRERAHELIGQAVQTAVLDRGTLAEALGAMTEVTAVMSARELADLDAPEDYLGAAEQLRKALLGD